MLFTKPRSRVGTPTATTLVVIALLVVLPLGCETLRPDPPPAVPAARSTQPSEATPTPTTVTLPGKHATRRGAYVFYHDFELDRDESLFAELEALPDQVNGELRLPPGNTVIQVFLFETQERYERYMFDRERGRYRHLPSRRAYFITEPRIGGGGDELKVFTWMSGGEHLRTDLRHELTHALLHGVLKDVPLWLDEGLAGYFELPPGNEGVNPSHLETLRRGPFQPDLARLEGFDQVRQMEKPEYRESWAWVHLMLRGSPESRKVLQNYLQVLRTNPNPGSLLERLQEVYPDTNEALAEHLGKIESPRQRYRPR